MAQVDANVAASLRNAILNICRHPRGCRCWSDIFGKYVIPRVQENEGKEFYKTTGDALDEHIFKCANNYFDHEAPFQLEDIIMSGSFSEGMLTMDFKNETMSDIDFMLILKNIEVTEDDQKKGNLVVKENSPFVKLYLTDKDLISTWADYLETSPCAGVEEGPKLSSMKLKERFRKNYVSYGPLLTPLNKEVVAKVDEGPSVEVCSRLPGNESTRIKSGVMHFPVGYMDFVLAIKCDGWPLCAQEWLCRPRRWPNQEIIKTIIDGGFYIVCKSSSEDGDFRLSYSYAEMVLIANLSELQHKTYRALKSFIKHYKNELSLDDEKVICSYHLKTIMLWYCEKSEPEDWTNDSVVRHLLSLVDDLIFALKEKKLPMYFMPKYNLMKQETDSTQIVQQMTELRFNLKLITEAIIAQEPTILDIIRFLFKTNLPEWGKLFVRGVAKGNFDAKDFLECIREKMKDCNQFWVDATGRLPSRDDVQGERTAHIILKSGLKSLKTLCVDLNHEYFNKTSEPKNENE